MEDLWVSDLNNSVEDGTVYQDGEINKENTFILIWIMVWGLDYGGGLAFNLKNFSWSGFVCKEN